MQLPFLCEKTGAIALMLLGLTVGRLAGRQNSAKLKKNLNYISDKIFKFLLFNKGTVLLLFVIKDSRIE